VAMGIQRSCATVVNEPPGTKSRECSPALPQYIDVAAVVGEGGALVVNVGGSHSDHVGVSGRIVEGVGTVVT